MEQIIEFLTLLTIFGSFFGLLWLFVLRPAYLSVEYVRELRFRLQHEPRRAFLDRKGGTTRRCPYCHDDLEKGSGVVCAQCLAHHHDECHDEHGACAACGDDALLGLTARRRTRQTRTA